MKSNLFNTSLLTDEVVERIRVWIKALRSGEYKQGVDALHNIKTNEYCCLGVAKTVCNLPERGNICLSDTYTLIGLHNESGDVSKSDEAEQSLVVMNDDQNKTFEEIADYIESELDKALAGK